MIPEVYKRNKGRIIKRDGRLAIVCGCIVTPFGQRLVLAVISGCKGSSIKHLMDNKYFYIYTHKNNKLEYLFCKEKDLDGKSIINVRIS